MFTKEQGSTPRYGARQGCGRDDLEVVVLTAAVATEDPVRGLSLLASQFILLFVSSSRMMEVPGDGSFTNHYLVLRALMMLSTQLKRWFSPQAFMPIYSVIL
ncbi:hypothetical protein Nepgr_028296 [Nepenthes gracilis]|uniref:Uncharacterized protein n=1 Tax=Nepenthes gracilis TaxID=150966 RepID=A0AAD3TC30_NEPGR|nr:hypothetical protein Nepgr_028296 [Nepenthes gracilis]